VAQSEGEMNIGKTIVEYVIDPYIVLRFNFRREIKHMIKKMLELDYVLSKWFAGRKKQEKVVPGATFLFLTKVMFLGNTIIVFIIKLLGITRPLIYVGGVLIFGLFLFIIMHDPIEQNFKRSLFEKFCKNLSKSQISRKRIFALLIYIGSLYFMVIGSILIQRIEF